MPNKKVPKSDKLVAQCAQLVDAKQKGAKNREKLVALTEGASQAASLSLYVDVPLPAMSRSLYYVVLYNTYSFVSSFFCLKNPLLYSKYHCTAARGE